MMVIDPYRFAPPALALSGAWAVWSIVCKVAGYSGAVIRVRRSSDNTEQDINCVGSVFDDALDTTALAAFVGANSAFVVKRYDQTGQGNHDGQVTAANQPRIVNAGVYDAKIVFDGSNSFLAAVNAGGTPSGMTVAIRGNLRSTAVQYQALTYYGPNFGVGGHNILYWGMNNDSSGSLGYNRANLTEGTAYIEAGFTQTLSNNVHCMVLDRTQGAINTKIVLYVDGTPVTHQSATAVTGTVATPTSFTSEHWYTGATDTAASPGQWDIVTQVIFESAKDATEAAAICAAIA